MKRGIIVLLAASATIAAAEEPQAPVAPPPDAAVQPEAPADQPTDRQAEIQRLLEQSQEQYRERYRQLLEERRQVIPPDVRRLAVIPLNRPCYFIRMVRPVLPESDQQRSGFIPLQARVNAVQRGPDCSNGGQLAPLIPTDRPDESIPQSEPALTPVVLAPTSGPAAAADR
jgi:hypothetical protein